MVEYIEREAFLASMRNLYCKDCNRRKGMKNGKLKTLYEIGEAPCRACGIDDVLSDVEDFPTADVLPVPDGGIGEMSDGYHTFNGLYYQRMVLFAALVKQNKEKAWKSLKHEDGELCFGGGWFIVGIDTPKGSYTYHYEDNFWSMFDCEELPVAKHWDGHTEKDVTRLLSLPDVQPVKHGKWLDLWVEDDEIIGGGFMIKQCSVCKEEMYYGEPRYCPDCGADMRGE